MAHTKAGAVSDQRIQPCTRSVSILGGRIEESFRSSRILVTSYQHDEGSARHAQQKHHQQGIGIRETIPDETPSIVATGSNAPVIVRYCRNKVVYDKYLLMEGLWAIYHKNR